MTCCRETSGKLVMIDVTTRCTIELAGEYAYMHRDRPVE